MLWKKVHSAAHQLMMIMSFFHAGIRRVFYRDCVCLFFSFLFFFLFCGCAFVSALGSSQPGAADTSTGSSAGWPSFPCFSLPSHTTHCLVLNPDVCTCVCMFADAVSHSKNKKFVFWHIKTVCVFFFWLYCTCFISHYWSLYKIHQHKPSMMIRKSLFKWACSAFNNFPQIFFQ